MNISSQLTDFTKQKIRLGMRKKHRHVWRNNAQTEALSADARASVTPRLKKLSPARLTVLAGRWRAVPRGCARIIVGLVPRLRRSLGSRRALAGFRRHDSRHLKSTFAARVFLCSHLKHYYVLSVYKQCQNRATAAASSFEEARVLQLSHKDKQQHYRLDFTQVSCLWSKPDDELIHDNTEHVTSVCLCWQLSLTYTSSAELSPGAKLTAVTY